LGELAWWFYTNLTMHNQLLLGAPNAARHCGAETNTEKKDILQTGSILSNYIGQACVEQIS